jgi:hypothetical protein
VRSGIPYNHLPCHCEKRSDEAIFFSSPKNARLLRSARNDRRVFRIFRDPDSLNSSPRLPSARCFSESGCARDGAIPSPAF